MQLKHVVPWGRNLHEYKEMGLFSDADSKKKILGCGDGPSSVNAELSAMGVDITSIDPIYQFSKEQIQKRIDETADVVANELRKHSENYIWKNVTDVVALVSLRLEAMRHFLEDYPQGSLKGRYQHQELPALRFDDGVFDLAWSSHFLFLYSEHFDTTFHLESIKEMLRVAEEVRIFPLLSLNNSPSPHLNVVLDYLEENGYTYAVVKSEYEFQKGAFETLHIRKRDETINT